MPKPWEVAEQQQQPPKASKPWEVDDEAFAASTGSGAASGSAITGQVQPQKKPSAWELFKRTPVVQGLREAVMAPVQIAAHSGIPERILQMRGVDPSMSKMAIGQVQEDIRAQEAESLAKSRKLYGDATGYELSRGIARTAPLAAATAGAGAPAGLAGMLGLGAIEGAAGGVMEPVTGKGDLRDFWKAKGGQALEGGIGGAAGGALGYGITKGLVPGVSKLFNALKKDGAVAPAAKQFYEDMDLLGLPRDLATAGQALGVKNAAQAYEKTMLGTGVLGPAKPMKKGYDALVAKARFIDERLQAKMRSAGFDGLPALEKAAEAGDRNAVRILTDVIPQAEQDAAGIIKGSLEVEKARRGKYVGRLYNDVDKLADPAGPVDLSGTKAVLAKVLEEESSFGGNEVLAKEAQRLIADLESTQGPAALYSQIRKKADKLGQKAQEWTSMNATPEQKSAAFALRDIRDSLRAEMGGHVESAGIPEAKHALAVATGAYRELMTPYKTKAIKNLLQTDATDEAVRGLINKYGTTRIPDKLIGAMGEKGKAAYRSAIISDKINKATSGDVLSLNKLAASIEDDAARLGKVFTPGEANELKAFANILRHMESSQLAYTVQQNGSKLLPIMLAGTGAGSVAALGAPTTGAALGLGLLGKFFTSGPGKKFTVAASKLPPGSPELEKIVEQAVRAMPRVAGATAAQNEQTEE